MFCTMMEGSFGWLAYLLFLGIVQILAHVRAWKYRGEGRLYDIEGGSWDYFLQKPCDK